MKIFERLQTLKNVLRVYTVQARGIMKPQIRGQAEEIIRKSNRTELKQIIDVLDLEVFADVCDFLILKEAWDFETKKDKKRYRDFTQDFVNLFAEIKVVLDNEDNITPK